MLSDVSNAGKRNSTVLMIGLAVALFGAVAVAGSFSDHFSFDFDPASKKQIGEATYKEVHDFFHKAETAIESKDLDGLMALYSDNYENAQHKKADARLIWKRIFDTFGELASKHNMRVISSSKENMMIVRCSGLLVGIPNGQQSMITVDNWTEQDHVIAKEDGAWKLIGTYGGENRKRLWFDRPMHPMF